MSAAEIGICARVEEITVEDVRNALWRERTLVKTWSMRGTLHLLASRDLPIYVAALKTRRFYQTDAWLKAQGASLDEINTITSETRNALDSRCLTRQELVNDLLKRTGLRGSIRDHLASGWGSLLHPAAYQGNLIFGPSQGKNITFVRPDQWLGTWDEPSSEEALRTLVRRFVTAFGPCSHGEFAHWWGILERDGKRIFQSMTDQFQEVEFEGRKKWLGKREAEEIVAIKPVKSVRLLPSFDPYVMFYSPREYLVNTDLRSKIFRKLAGWVSPVLLIDGVAAGTWEAQKNPGRVKVTVQPFRSLTVGERARLREEAVRLGEFLSAKVELAILA